MVVGGGGMQRGVDVHVEQSLTRYTKNEISLVKRNA